MIEQALEWSARGWTWYAALELGAGLALSASAIGVVLRHRREHAPSLAGRGTLPPVSLVLISGDDAPDLDAALDLLATQDYPAFELIVVSDGPLGGHLARAMARLHATPIDLIYRPIIPTARVVAVYHGATTIDVVIVEKERAGLADALNAGLNTARSPYICVLGEGVRLERSALTLLMAAVLDDPDRVIAAAGIERVLNGTTARETDLMVHECPRRPAELWGVLDGLRAGLAATGLSPLTGLVSAARGCLLLQKKAVLRVGGFLPAAGAERPDLLLRLRRQLGAQGVPHRSVFIPRPVAWIKVPDTLKAAAADRRRRIAGGLVCAIAHLLRAPWTLREAAWRLVTAAWSAALLAPAIDLTAMVWVAGLFAARMTSGSTVFFVWAALVAGRTAVSCAAVLLHEMTPKRYPLERDVTRLFVVAWIEPLLARPLLAWWASRAVWSVLRAGGREPGFAGTLLGSRAADPPRRHADRQPQAEPRRDGAESEQALRAP